MPTAPAKRKGKGGPKHAKKPAKVPPKAQKKQPAKKKPGKGKSPQAQANFLATVQEACPGITSDQMAERYGYSLDELNNLRAFVLEYVKDFSPAMACLRMGYPVASAESTGAIMLGNAYVQLRVEEYFKRAEPEAIVSIGQIHAKLWKEMNAPDTVMSGCAMSNSSTRIAAGKLLLQARGQLQPKPKEADPIAARRVMFIPVPVGNWEDGARQSQKELKESTVVDV